MSPASGVKRKILVVAGASGGHIFPALRLIDTLKEKDANLQLRLILPSSCLKKAISDTQAAISYIPVVPFKRSLGLGFLALFNFLKGSAETLFILLSWRPELVIGFGGIASVPALVFAWLLRTRTVIHEQNVLPGRANRLLANISDRIAISFPQSKNYFKAGIREKIVLTGNPIRKQFARIDKTKALDFLGLAGGKFTIMVMGGSLGSRRINYAFLEALPMIAGRDKLQVIHLAGEKDYASLKEAYSKLGIKANLFAFLEAIEYAYSASDLVVSRAGAAAITEIMFFALPAVIIPYPFAYAHQLANARVLERMGSAIIIKDEELTSRRLAQVLNNLINNPDGIQSLRAHYSGWQPCPQAAELLAEELLSTG